MPNRKKKHNAAVAVFETKARADHAVADLKAAGFTDSEIGMVYHDAEGKAVKTGAANESHAEEGAVAGAVAGAAGGALVGAGILAGVIPVIGPVLALGTLGTVLVNAAGGAAIVGLTGALVGWGIPEEDAEFYENEVQAGRYLVTVDTTDRIDEARLILHRNGGFDRCAWAAVRADRAITLSEGGIRTEDGRVIQLKEEQLRANKETVNQGDVKVRKEVHTEHQQITVPVEHEEVVIERRPANGRHAKGDVVAEEIRIPVKEERVKVSKETVVKEDVNISKRKVRSNETVSGDVRKEDLVVDPTNGAKVRQTHKTSRK
ncbi:MAG: YsnF/AvaK domain-containing protein [Planctomycetes bacterium]|nr:YsnF/AvaK domain-containing protein [Planctomycetota bacterium]